MFLQWWSSACLYGVLEDRKCSFLYRSGSIIIFYGSGSGYGSRSSKKVRQTLISAYYFVTSFLLFIYEHWLKGTFKKKQAKKRWKKFIFSWHLVSHWRKKQDPESGSESESQWYGSAIPDPYQHVTDPQHWPNLPSCTGEHDDTSQRLLYSLPACRDSCPSPCIPVHNQILSYHTTEEALNVMNLLYWNFWTW